MTLSPTKAKSILKYCEQCSFTCTSDRDLRYHTRSVCTRQGLDSAQGKVRQDVFISLSSSAHVRQDYETPPGNIDPEPHHSVTAATPYMVKQRDLQQLSPKEDDR